jgi:hypothetical protein
LIAGEAGSRAEPEASGLNQDGKKRRSGSGLERSDKK